MPWRTPEEPQLSVLWLCDEHAPALVSSLPECDDGTVSTVERTCRRDVGGFRCGAFATHVAIFDVGGTLRLTSLCERHLSEEEAP
jgi:hypothetical protein